MPTPPTEDQARRDAQLADVVVDVTAGLIAAHRAADTARITAELGKLLNAIAAYCNPQKQRDAALGRAISRLGSDRR